MVKGIKSYALLACIVASQVHAFSTPKIKVPGFSMPEFTIPSATIPVPSASQIGSLIKNHSTAVGIGISAGCLIYLYYAQKRAQNYYKQYDQLCTKKYFAQIALDDYITWTKSTITPIAKTLNIAEEVLNNPTCWSFYVERKITSNDMARLVKLFDRSLSAHTLLNEIKAQTEYAKNQLKKYISAHHGIEKTAPLANAPGLHSDIRYTDSDRASLVYYQTCLKKHLKTAQLVSKLLSCREFAFNTCQDERNRDYAQKKYYKNHKKAV